MSSPAIRGHLNEVTYAWDELELLSASYKRGETLHEVVTVLVNHQTVRVLLYFAHYALIWQKCKMARNNPLQELAANLTSGQGKNVPPQTLQFMRPLVRTNGLKCPLFPSLAAKSEGGGWRLNFIGCLIGLSQLIIGCRCEEHHV